MWGSDACSPDLCDCPQRRAAGPARARGRRHDGRRSAADRACLTKVADGYFAALKANDAKRVSQATGARITENGSGEEARRYLLGRRRGRDLALRHREPDAGAIPAPRSVIRNADGSKTMYLLRLKVHAGAITEIETIKANQGDADRAVGARPARPRMSQRPAAVDPRGRPRFVLRPHRRRGKLLARVPDERHAEVPPRTHPAAGRPAFENGLQTTGRDARRRLAATRRAASMKAASSAATSGTGATRWWTKSAASCCPSCASA